MPSVPPQVPTEMKSLGARPAYSTDVPLEPSKLPFWGEYDRVVLATPPRSPKPLYRGVPPVVAARLRTAVISRPLSGKYQLLGAVSVEVGLALVVGKISPP